VPSSIIALIPARSGSKRIPGKNIRCLGGHPLIAYTIATAIESKVFQEVLVSTDSEQIAAIARHYGAEVPFLRSEEISNDVSPDIEWVDYTLRKLEELGRCYDCFSLLRPTSPLRTAETIRRAWREFHKETGIDSLRAVEKCRQHPGKMWIVRDRRMTPLLKDGTKQQPWHSSQYQSLPVFYIQNASLEIAWSRVVFEGRTIAGEAVMPFFTEGFEGFDINDPDDWTVAEHKLSKGEISLPHISAKPYPFRKE